MTKRLPFARLLFCLSLFSLTLPALAQPYRDAGNDPIVKLEKAGWKILKNGVLQRQIQPGKTETFVFGVEGFTWKLQELGRQLAVLRQEFKASSTPELRRAIASHRKAIASTLETLERAQAAEANGEAILPKTDCTISFSYDAVASYKTDLQGTWAEANANFNVSPGCGMSGEVYAYAFAQATVNGSSTTATVTDGPRSGASVNASADANRNGGRPCESFAFASVTSNDLNPSSYSTEQTNEICPAPPPPHDQGGGGGSCPQCTTYANGSQCCVSCWCDGSGMPVACTQNICPPDRGEGRD